MMFFCIAVCIGGCHAIGGYCNNSGHCRWVLNEHSGTASTEDSIMALQKWYVPRSRMFAFSFSKSVTV